MSAEMIDEVGRLAGSAAVEAAWGQWSALTHLAAPRHTGRAGDAGEGTGSVGDAGEGTGSVGDAGGAEPAWTIVDPEALVLASLALAPVERRLEDLVAAWAREAGFLMSKPRFKRLAPRFPETVEERVGDFAYYAAEGGDSRWKSWASASEPDPYPRTKSPGPLRLTAGPALVLRLRAGFGVNAKADVLGMLLGLAGEPADLKEIAAATAYTERMIRTATEEMTLAGFVFEIEGRPSSFWADPERWVPLLGPGGTGVGEPSSKPTRAPIPPWRDWSAVFAFLCGASDWAERALENGWSDYVAASRARDLHEEHKGRLDRAGIRASPSPVAEGEATGAAFLETFRRLVSSVGSWAGNVGG